MSKVVLFLAMLACAAGGAAVAYFASGPASSGSTAPAQVKGLVAAEPAYDLAIKEAEASVEKLKQNRKAILDGLHISERSRVTVLLDQLESGIEPTSEKWVETLTQAGFKKTLAFHFGTRAIRHPEYISISKEIWGKVPEYRSAKRLESSAIYFGAVLIAIPGHHMKRYCDEFHNKFVTDEDSRNFWEQFSGVPWGRLK